MPDLVPDLNFDADTIEYSSTMQDRSEYGDGDNMSVRSQSLNETDGDELPDGDWDTLYYETRDALREDIGDAFSTDIGTLANIETSEWVNGQLLAKEVIAPIEESEAAASKAHTAKTHENESNRPYNLRARTEKQILCNGDWGDNDLTGDYYPSTKAANKKLQRSSTKQQEDENDAALHGDARQYEVQQNDSDVEATDDSQPLPIRKSRRKNKNKADANADLQPTSARPTIACNACEEANNQARNTKKTRIDCSLFRDKSQTIPCQQCKAKGITCTFGTLALTLANDNRKADSSKASSSKSIRPVPALAQAKNKKSVNSSKASSSKSIRPVSALAQAKNKKSVNSSKASSSKSIRPAGNEIWITTYFCHPFKFNNSPDNTDPDAMELGLESSSFSHSCNFCLKPTYGIYGLGKKKIKILDPLDGTGYIEHFGGGHKEDGLLPSKMCQACTLSRLQVLECKDHFIQTVSNKAELDAIIASHPKITTIMAALDDQKEAGNKDIHICSICPRIAIYECTAMSQYDEDGMEVGAANENGDAIEGIAGCGLRLCQPCANLLAEKDGDLSAAIKKATLSTSTHGHYPNGVRADADFLRYDGLLIKQLTHQMGKDGLSE